MGIASLPELVTCPRQIFKELRLSVDAVEATRSSLVAAVARQRRMQPEKQKARNLAVSGPFPELSGVRCYLAPSARWSILIANP
jgi:hypothetical protein